MKINKWFLVIICFSILKINVAQVNYVSGNISYRKLGGGCSSSLNIEVTLTLYTKSVSTKNKAVLNFGDGDTAHISRTDSVRVGNGILRSRYKINHYYTYCGDYTISYYDSLNIKNALNAIGTCKRFYIQTLFSTNMIFSDVNSPVNYAPGANTANKNKSYHYNPTSVLAGNLFGDSTIHTLFSVGSNNVPCFVIPQGVKINRYSGEIVWSNPDTLGDYLFYITTKTYRFGSLRCSKVSYAKINVSNGSPTYQTDSLTNIPLNNLGFKEFSFTPNSTYTFHIRHKDPAADSIRLFIYPLDFYNTLVQYTYTTVTSKDHLLKVNWSPTSIDIRDNPYTVVINARSYYPNDSVANSYQTVSYKYANSVIGISENEKRFTNLKLVPNPFSDKLTLQQEGNHPKNFSLKVFNHVGQIVYSQEINSTLVDIDLSYLVNGMYFVKVSDGSESRVFKIVKE